MTWAKASQKARQKMLLDDTGPKPIPVLSKDGRDLLVKVYEKTTAERRAGLSWSILLDNGQVHSKYKMPCWGELASSNAVWVRDQNARTAGLLISVPDCDRKMFNAWKDFVTGSGLWLSLPEKTEPVSPTAFVIHDLNYPAQLFINYLIALRVPSRNPLVVRRWLDWQSLGLSPLVAFLFASVFSPVARTSQVCSVSERYEYPITGWSLVTNKMSLSRIANRAPLLMPNMIFSSTTRGIPNNIIWETRGRSNHFLTTEEVARIRSVGFYRDLFTTDQALDIACRLEDSLKSKTKGDLRG